jgi:hypothetical protein
MFVPESAFFSQERIRCNVSLFVAPVETTLISPGSFSNDVSLIFMKLQLNIHSQYWNLLRWNTNVMTRYGRGICECGRHSSTLDVILIPW